MLGVFKYSVVRTLILATLWSVAAFWVAVYIPKEVDRQRFETLILSNGRVSSVQRESLFSQPTALKPGDRILQINGENFEWSKMKRHLESLSRSTDVRAKVKSKGELKDTTLQIREYTRRDLLSLGILPAIVSIIFLLFALLTPFQRFDNRKNQEAVEVFSFLCFGVSLFFLGFFPSVTLAIPYPSSILNPILAVLFVHLFSVYPKKKASKKIRVSALGFAYTTALALTFLRVGGWFSETPSWFDLSEFFWFGSCVIVAMACLGNTLFTSRDFWTLRRAKVLSVVFVLSFMALVSIFVSFLWEGPRISLERLLAASLLFPSFFAFVFSKENVFDLERIFRRGLHQVLFLGIAITLSILLGFGWEQWLEAKERDWMLWAAIAMVVALFARPVGLGFEKMMTKLWSGKIRFPRVEELSKTHQSIESFLQSLAMECEKHLGMRSITFRFVKDPTKAFSPENEQIWRLGHSKLHRVYQKRVELQHQFDLKRGGLSLGEFSFSGGDALAFDPQTNSDFKIFLDSIAIQIELLVLREYLVAQQGLLAVGRMQALLAHEMKNPLAVIKVCAGLLQDRLDSNEEAEELLKTIHLEVNRVSQAVQNVFNHSGREERSESVDVCELVDAVRAEVLARFPQGTIECLLEVEDQKTKWEPGALFVWTQREGLRQSLINLLINSFEAGSSWAGVDVQLKAQHFLRIAVKDRGPGIPRSLELFKPFVSTKANGTGLGLSHVKSFVDRQSGRIQVSSEVGVGTNIVLEFSPQLAVRES